MPANKKNPEVDAYFTDAKKWTKELKKLRAILLKHPLTEEIKWRSPCYTFKKKNVVILNSLNDSCALGFFKGALIKDPHGHLEKPGENTQSGRLLRFTGVRQIEKMRSAIDEYIQAAIEVEKVGKKVDFKKVADYPIPGEFQIKLAESSKLKAAFQALTPGRQKAYLLHFAGAKQSKTRTARVEKCIPKILDGIGLHDCTCGLSAKMPSCDGSHRQLKK